METQDMEVAAINDLLTIENAAYLLKHDSVYGRYGKEVKVHEGHLHVGEKKIACLSEKDPAKLP